MLKEYMKRQGKARLNKESIITDCRWTYES